MAKNIRIGSQMARAAQIVGMNPGCSKLFVASQLLPHAIGHNNAMAYGPVDRAIRAGLIRAEAGKGNAYALFAAEQK